jgi:hypothetical protein
MGPVHDTSFIPAGRVGLMVDSGAAGAFDNVTVTQQAKPPERPDLQTMSITPSTSAPIVGQTITVTVGVLNAGDATASNVRVDFWTNLTSSPSVGSTSTLTSTAASVPAGGYAHISFEGLTVSADTTWRMYAVVDTLDAHVESNENNNVFGPETLHWDYDLYEPDDTYATASTIVPGQSQDHTLMPYYDEDWVKFTVSGTTARYVTVYTVATGGTAYRYMYIYLYREPFVGIYDYIASDYNYYGTCAISGSLTPGTYYVRVYSGYRSGSYTLYLSMD